MIRDNIISLAAISISIISLFFTRKSVEQSQKHNKNSVLPIADIRLAVLKDRISITFTNAGTGPLRVDNFYYSNDNGKCDSSIRSFLAPERLAGDDNKLCRWNNINNMTFSADEKIKLLSFEKRKDADSEAFKESKIFLLQECGALTIHVEYSDIYEQKFSYSKGLSFFTRKYDEAITKMAREQEN